MGKTTRKQKLKSSAVAFALLGLLPFYQNCSGRPSHSAFQETPLGVTPNPSDETGNIPDDPSTLPVTPVDNILKACAPSNSTIPDYVTQIKPIIEKNCKSCHMDGRADGTFQIGNYASDEAARAEKTVWTHVYSAIKSGAMPKNRTMDSQEKDLVLLWLTSTPKGADPGFVGMQRLTPKQWDNSVSDLLGFKVSLSSQFPKDPIGKGQFSNNASLISSINLEYFAKLRTLTDSAVDAAFNDQTAKAKLLACGSAPASNQTPVKILVTDSIAKIRYSGTTTDIAGTSQISSNGRLTFQIPANRVPANGNSITITAGGPQRTDWPRFNMYVNGVQVATNFAAASEMWIPFSFPATIVANQATRVDIDYINDPEAGGTDLWVESIELYSGGGSSSSGGLTNACAENLLLDFARRAYRRPIATTKNINDIDAHIESDSVKRFVVGLSSEADLETAVKLGYKAILLSPKFLYRTVILASPNDAEAIERLDAFEVASQLSYFLWNSIPDETLFNAAKNDLLSTEQELRAQITRMLADPRSKTLAKNLANEWLGLNQLDLVSPSDAAYTANTREAMRTETETFMEYIVRNDQSPLDVIDAKYSFVNGELASLYGISGVSGNTFSQVTLPTNRKGILGHGSILTLTTHASKTSPIHRGVYALGNLMCESPPPPPPGIPTLDEVIAEGTIREVLAAHRTNVTCNSCHKTIDPIGLSLENFDVIGRYRITYPDGQAVDASGTLEDGTSFNGLTQFADSLVANKKFGVCMTKKALSLAIARDLDINDTCATQKLGEVYVDSNKTFTDFVLAVALSDQFKKRRGSGE